MAELSERQQTVLSYIRQCIQTSNYPPTQDEIADEIGMSSIQPVNDTLKALEREVYIMIRPYRPRGICLTQKGKQAN